MRIITLVGPRKAGKTTTVEELIRAIRKRGKTVATCKSIGCPAFCMDQRGSNTMRHRLAGADAVCARGKRETDFVVPSVLPLSQILKHYAAMQYVLLEGDAQAPVPRLVAAHTIEDARERVNSQTFALVGKIAETPPMERDSLGLPAFDPRTESEALLDLIDSTVPDLDPTDEALAGLDISGDTGLSQKNRAFCAMNCTHHGKQAVTVSVGGEEIKLTEEQRQTVLAGAGLLKNTVGIFGMLGILAACAYPFLQLGVQYLLYKLTAFLASAVGAPSLCKLIDGLGGAFGLVLGMTGACALLLLVSVLSSVAAVMP